MGVLWSLYLGFLGAVLIPVSTSPEFEGDSSGVVVAVIFGIIALVILALSALAIVGGIFAVQRRKWGLALAGAIAAIFTSIVLGILATIFVSISKKDFAP